MRKYLSCLAAICLVSSALVAQDGKTYRAELTGSQQVPAVETWAGGRATFTVTNGSTSLNFTVTVSRIDNVSGAKLHLGSAGTNGPAVATLYNGPTIPGTSEGTLAAGQLTVLDLTGPLQDSPMSELFRLIEAGEIYVNVTTELYDMGEIRGQVH